jgi:hypothetical protein
MAIHARFLALDICAKTFDTREMPARKAAGCLRDFEMVPRRVFLRVWGKSGAGATVRAMAAV